MAANEIRGRRDGFIAGSLPSGFADVQRRQGKRLASSGNRENPPIAGTCEAAGDEELIEPTSAIVGSMSFGVGGGTLAGLDSRGDAQLGNAPRS